MANNLAKAYVLTCATIASLALVVMIILHVSALRGFALSSPHTLALGMLASLPLLGLAKERNIWKNEIRALPRWVGLAVSMLFVYCFFIFAAILFLGNIHTDYGASVLISGFFVMFLSLSLPVPFALLRSDYVSPETRNKRVLMSLVFVSIGILITTLVRLDLLPTHHSNASIASQDFNV
jgi:hypothetical protein